LTKVAIVGGAPRSKNLAPYDDEAWEIWGLGVHLKDHSRISRIFEIHQDMSYESDAYPQMLADKRIPLVVSDQFPIMADHITTYPMDKAMSLMGGMLTSSTAYMMAYAILEGVTHINIYGVDMDVCDKEYFYQRPGMYAWIGYARALGIKVEVPESSLFHDKLYPANVLESRNPTYNEVNFLAMADLHSKEIEKCHSKIAQLNRVIDTHSGCKQVYERLSKVARATDAGIEVLSFEHSTNIKEP